MTHPQRVDDYLEHIAAAINARFGTLGISEIWAHWSKTNKSRTPSYVPSQLLAKLQIGSRTWLRNLSQSIPSYRGSRCVASVTKSFTTTLISTGMCFGTP